MRWFSLIALLSLSLPPMQVWAASVMVNEFYNGSGAVAPGTKMTRDEYIEFVITEPTTAADLAKLTFGDTNDATSQLQGVLRFDQATLETALSSSGLSAFQAGTIIVVKGAGLGAQNLTYNPTGLNLTDSDAWSIELVAGQGARDHSETRINGNVSIGNNGDVVWISSGNPPVNNSDTSGFVHAIGYDNSPGLIARNVAGAFGAENIYNGTMTTGRSLANNGGATESLGISAATSMGTANSAANSAWIVGGLRTGAAVGLAPEPGRVSLMVLAGAVVILKRRRQGGGHV